MAAASFFANGSALLEKQRGKKDTADSRTRRSKGRAKNVYNLKQKSTFVPHFKFYLCSSNFN
ncbi:MAG: hypothetical protein CFE23_09795 [Flavobacterium sp. BFFFF1]|nr:MAG: hypothetical protein CFE23_09795 [Flavobacterium sp. BFFFF1]